MGKKCLTLDLAQLEIVNHLTAWKAGVLFKAVVNYWLTGEVSPWGEDADLKPIFMLFRAKIEEQREEDKAQQSKDKRSERNRRYYLRRFKTIKTLDQENEGEGKKRTKRKVGEVKEPTKETIYAKKETDYETKKDTVQGELFEPEEAQGQGNEPKPKGKVRPTGDAEGGPRFDGEPRFRKPSVADIAEYVKAKGYEQWVDAEAFWSYHENRDLSHGHFRLHSA